MHGYFEPTISAILRTCVKSCGGGKHAGAEAATACWGPESAKLVHE